MTSGYGAVASTLVTNAQPRDIWQTVIRSLLGRKPFASALARVADPSESFHARSGFAWIHTTLAERSSEKLAAKDRHKAFAEGFYRPSGHPGIKSYDVSAR